MNERGHVDELAPAYALGVLSQDEAAALERHAAECAPCRKLVGEAEETVTAMVEAGPLHYAKRVRRSNPLAPWMLSAASLLIALGLGARLLQMSSAPPQAVAQHGAAVTAIVHSHFQHAPMIPRAPGAPAGKVLFARDRSWILVELNGKPDDLQIAASTPAGTRILGRPAAYGDSAEFFYKSAEPIREVLVLRGSQVVESARL